jgi:hypothetical protein
MLTLSDMNESVNRLLLLAACRIDSCRAAECFGHYNTIQCEQVVSELALAEEMEREILEARREAVREVRACKRVRLLGSSSSSSSSTRSQQQRDDESAVA